MYIKTTHEERGYEFQREQGARYMEEFRERKENEEIMSL